MERSDLEFLFSRMNYVSQVHNIEDAMIHQPFLMDSDVLVREVLTETGLRVHDFVRFEVGQSN
jgi:translation elongation factor EF-Ts